MSSPYQKVTVQEFAVTLFAEFKEIEEILGQNRDLAIACGANLLGNEVYFLKIFALDVATSLGLLGSPFREVVLDAFTDLLREADPSVYPLICERINQYDQAVRDSLGTRMDPSLPVEYAAATQFAEFLGMKRDSLVIAKGVCIMLSTTERVREFIRNVEIF